MERMSTGRWIKGETIDERYERYIETCALSIESKKILQEWANEMRANKFLNRDTLALIRVVIRILQKIGKNIENVTKEDLQAFFTSNTFERVRIELWYKKTLKRFFRWLSKNRDDLKYLLFHYHNHHK